jgi:peptide-methionine (S)-S-oxide reductase
MNNNIETIVLGGGCFWCIEAVFLNIKGVLKVTSGYSGGTTDNPTYEQVCTGKTGHAEVLKIEYDPKIVTFETLLDIFFTIHDPTTLNRQGSDIGTQYRSIILFTTNEQKEKAINFIKNIQEKFDQPIVTEIKQLTNFYPAESYHQNYYEKNPHNPYCAFQIPGKLTKVEKKFRTNLKSEKN